MTWTADASGSKTATVPSAATFTNASANIGVTNTCAAGDIVTLTTTGTLPTNFSPATPLYVIATGLSGSNIQLSATPGGSPIVAGSAGSGTHTATVEHVLDQPNTNATYEFAVDTTNMALGDIVELRVYEAIDGTNFRQCWRGGAYQGVQISPGKKSLGVPSPTKAQFTIKQLAGTGRAFPWRVVRI